MNRDDFERIDKQLHACVDQSKGYSADEIFILFKFKELELLEEISVSLKSVAASLRGEK